MPRPRFHKLPAERQQLILQTAAQAFATHGFDASLNQIVEGAGMSKGSVYYYFDDKADLFATVLRDTWDRLFPMEDIDISSLDAESFWPAIRDWYVQTVEGMQEIPWIVGLGRAAYSLPEEVLEGTVFGHQLAQLRDLGANLIEHGQKLGAVRTDLPSGLLLTMLAAAGMASDRWMVDHWEELGDQAMAQVIIDLFAFFQEMLSPPCAEVRHG